MQPHLPNLSPHPTYNVENYYLEFLPIFNIVLGGGEGRQQRVFKRIAALFSNFSRKIQIVRYIT